MFNNILFVSKYNKLNKLTSIGNLIELQTKCIFDYYKSFVNFSKILRVLCK